MNDANSKVLFEQTDKVFEFKLNNNKTLNAIDQEMVTIMAKQLKKWHDAPKEEVPRVALISGTGGKAFCAGGDVKTIWQELTNLAAINKHGDIGTGKKGHMHTDFFREEYKMNHLLGNSTVPQISFWDGFVMGGGVGLSVLGEFRISD